MCQKVIKKSKNQKAGLEKNIYIYKLVSNGWTLLLVCGVSQKSQVFHAEIRVFTVIIIFIPSYQFTPELTVNLIKVFLIAILLSTNRISEFTMSLKSTLKLLFFHICFYAVASKLRTPKDKTQQVL